MRHLPIPMSMEDLVAILNDITDSIEGGDSFEGSLEYLMPMPPAGHEVTLGELQGDPGCTTCGMGVRRSDAEEIGEDPVAMLARAHQGDPATTAAGERTDFMVRASYRIGNRDGQGGMRMVGEFG